MQTKTNKRTKSPHHTYTHTHTNTNTTVCFHTDTPPFVSFVCMLLTRVSVGRCMRAYELICVRGDMDALCESIICTTGGAATKRT